MADENINNAPVLAIAEVVLIKSDPKDVGCSGELILKNISEK
jgi:hypothetical protein